MTEGRDRTRVQFEACAACGFDPSTVPDAELGGRVVREVAAWGRMLAAADPVDRRSRPAPDVWSAVEYACHTRDLLAVMADRVRRMRAGEGRTLGWWDHERAAREERYATQDPVLVVEGLGANARDFAGALSQVEGSEWDRRADRRPGEHFTVRGLARFTLHEVVHHRDDADRSMRGVVSVEETPAE